MYVHPTTTAARKFPTINLEFLPALTRAQERLNQIGNVLEYCTEQYNAAIQACWDGAWEAFKLAHPNIDVVTRGNRDVVIVLKWRTFSDGTVGMSESWCLQDSFRWDNWSSSVPEDDESRMKVSVRSCYATSDIDAADLEYYRKWLAVATDMVNGAPWVEEFKAAAKAASRKETEQWNAENPLRDKAREESREISRNLQRADVWARLITADDAGQFNADKQTKSEWEQLGFSIALAKQGAKKYNTNKEAARAALLKGNLSDACFTS